ncbi:MAG: hypothetical protein ABFE01_07405 [Phycisphaerales bacterium]
MASPHLLAVDLYGPNGVRAEKVLQIGTVADGRKQTVQLSRWVAKAVQKVLCVDVDVDWLAHACAPVTR